VTILEAIRESRKSPAMWLVFGLLVLMILAFLLNPNQPLLERHSFRQTQTAITAYYLMQGGPFFDYLTPVLGYPWTIPLELPLFQALVAGIASMFGTALDVTGRAVSYFFFLLTCVPIALCLRRYGAPAVAAAIAIFLTSPVNLFYARAFLMETMATFLALVSLCLYIGFRRTGKAALLAGFVVAGTLAGLQKVTTFLPVLAVCGLDLAWVNFKSLLRREWRAVEWGPAVLLAVSLVLPAWWAIYSDSVKSTGPLSSLLMSSNLHEWNFGTVAQRLDPGYWSEVYYDRLLIYGGLSVALVLVAIAIWQKRALFNREALLFGGAGVLGPLVFSNLHLVHDYYQLASIVFLGCAASIVISPLLSEIFSASQSRYALVVILLASVNLWFFNERYFSLWFHERSLPYTLGQFLKESVREQDVVIVFGLEWSSTLPYYASRYALMVPDRRTTPPELRAAIVRNPRSFTGDREIGSVVYCKTTKHKQAKQNAEMEALFARLDGPVQTVWNCSIKTRAWSAERDGTRTGGRAGKRRRVADDRARLRQVPM
jgi:hypothetical protein